MSDRASGVQASAIFRLHGRIIKHTPCAGLLDRGGEHIHPASCGKPGAGSKAISSARRAREIGLSSVRKRRLFLILPNSATNEGCHIDAERFGIGEDSREARRSGGALQTGDMGLGKSKSLCDLRLGNSFLLSHPSEFHHDLDRRPLSGDLGLRSRTKCNDLIEVVRLFRYHGCLSGLTHSASGGREHPCRRLLTLLFIDEQKREDLLSIDDTHGEEKASILPVRSIFDHHQPIAVVLTSYPVPASTAKAFIAAVNRRSRVLARRAALGWSFGHRTTSISAPHDLYHTWYRSQRRLKHLQRVHDPHLSAVLPRRLRDPGVATRIAHGDDGRARRRDVRPLAIQE